MSNRFQIWRQRTIIYQCIRDESILILLTGQPPPRTTCQTTSHVLPRLFLVPGSSVAWILFLVQCLCHRPICRALVCPAKKEDFFGLLSGIIYPILLLHPPPSKTISISCQNLVPHTYSAQDGGTISPLGTIFSTNDGTTLLLNGRRRASQSRSTRRARPWPRSASPSSPGAAILPSGRRARWPFRCARRCNITPLLSSHRK